MPKPEAGSWEAGQAAGKRDSGRMMGKRRKEPAGETGKRIKKKAGRRTGVKKALAAAGVLLFLSLAGTAAALALLYFSGRAKIQALSGKGAPEAGLLTDAEAAEDIRMKAGLSTLQWQEDWVAFEGKVYSYDSSRINLLVLGVDKAGKMGGEPDYENWRSGQTDAIFVVSIDPSGRSVSIIGVPRNAMTSVDVYDSEDHVSRTIYDQICLQYPYAGGGAHGLEKAAEAVSGLLYGLPIHGTAAVGYDAVSRVNDMAGGVDVVALESLDTSFGSYQEGEELHLEGEYVLAYVRGRDTGVVGSPTMRLERQKQYLAALAEKVKGEVRKDPLLFKEMYEAVSGYINTDMGIDELVYLAGQAAGYQFSLEDIYLLPGEDKVVPILEDGKETGDFYDDFYLDEEKLKEILVRVFYKEVKLEG